MLLWKNKETIVVRFNEILGALSSSMTFGNNISFSEKLKHSTTNWCLSVQIKKKDVELQSFMWNMTFRVHLLSSLTIFEPSRSSPYHYLHIKIYTLLRNTVTEYNNFQVIQHHVGFKRVFHYSESLTSSFAST